MNKRELETRTKQFALRIIAFAATLPPTKVGDIVTYQLVKAGTSVGANYREANRAESRNDFIHKLAIVQKELSESQYWLELCEGANWAMELSANGCFRRQPSYSPSLQARQEPPNGTGNESNLEIRI